MDRAAHGSYGRYCRDWWPMHMSGPIFGVCKKACLNILVGSSKHNILSITSLADSGGSVKSERIDLFHEELGLHV